MKNIKCRFCDEKVWYGGMVSVDDAFEELHYHVRSEHTDVWRDIELFIADVDAKLESVMSLVYEPTDD
jgi:hypothetical protein